MAVLPNWLLSSDALVEKARKCVVRKQFSKACDAVQRVISRLDADKSLSPDQRRRLGLAWLYKGQAERKLRHEDLAQAALMSAAGHLELPNADFLWLLDRALRQGDWSQAIRSLAIHFVMRRAESASEIGRSIARRMQTIASRTTQAYTADDAIQWHEQAVSAAGDTGWLHEGLGRLLIEKKRFAEAVSSLRMAAKLMPQAEDVRLHLALAFTETGNHASGLRELEQIFRRQTSPGSALLLAHVLRRLKRFDNAAKAFDYARKHGANFAEADDLAHAEALANTGQWYAVCKLVTRYEGSPRRPWRWLASAAFSASGQHDQATAVARALTPDDLASSEALRVHVLGIATHASDPAMALDLLGCFPTVNRTPAWYGLSGTLHAALNHWRPAFDAWSGLPVEQRVAAIAPVVAEQASQTLPPWLECAEELTGDILASDGMTKALVTYLDKGAAGLRRS